ncbi:MAG: hypothetical protein PWQ17_2161 [Anaerophaga sp.]|nr:hypothetical protein [Anaerophaga sp.]MDN5292355.1 hypothetical protein [Anaerophaga sp.]
MVQATKFPFRQKVVYPYFFLLSPAFKNIVSTKFIFYHEKKTTGNYPDNSNDYSNKL